MNFYNNSNNILNQYLRNFYLAYNRRTYKKLFKINKINKLKIKKNKNKFKCKLNLLNSFYSYTVSYIFKYVYYNMYKIKYMKHISIDKNNNINTVILYCNKLFIKKKQKKSMKYDIIMGSGSNRSWVGIGVNKNSVYKNACSKSSYKSKQYIYNLNFKPNDYKVFKYKNYRFSMLDKRPNKYNLNVYNNIIFLSGLKKLKLISHTKSNTKNVLKSILHYFN